VVLKNGKRERKMIEIKRSLGRVCWHVLYNGRLLDTAGTKREAQDVAASYRLKLLTAMG